MREVLKEHWKTGSRKVVNFGWNFLQALFGSRARLWRLHRRQRRLNEQLRSNREEIELQDLAHNLEWVRCEIEIAITDALLTEADKLHISKPSFGDRKKWNLSAPSRTLSHAGIEDLRSRIRKEKRERQEIIEWWVKVVGGLITILTGLVGALIGLIAILRS